MYALASLTHDPKLFGTSRSVGDLQNWIHVGIGVGTKDKFKKPKIVNLSIEKQNYEQPGKFYITSKRLMGWWQSFLYTIDLNELRIRLPDTTH